MCICISICNTVHEYFPRNLANYPPNHRDKKNIKEIIQQKIQPFRCHRRCKGLSVDVGGNSRSSRPTVFFLGVTNPAGFVWLAKFADQTFGVTLWQTNSSPLKVGHPKRKESSNHQFSGAMLVSGSVNRLMKGMDRKHLEVS